MDPELEKMCFKMIASGGESRSMVFEALKLGRQGRLTEAWAVLEESRKLMAEAHRNQTKLLQQEAQGKILKNTILLVHAQDILMAAITERDLAEFILSLLDRVQELEDRTS
jgi:PTS system cellobiose-specific IIA component